MTDYVAKVVEIDDSLKDLLNGNNPRDPHLKKRLFSKANEFRKGIVKLAKYLYKLEGAFEPGSYYAELYTRIAKIWNSFEIEFERDVHEGISGQELLEGAYYRRISSVDESVANKIVPGGRLGFFHYVDDCNSLGTVWNLLHTYFLVAGFASLRRLGCGKIYLNGKKDQNTELIFEIIEKLWKYLKKGVLTGLVVNSGKEIIFITIKLRTGNGAYGHAMTVSIDFKKEELNVRLWDVGSWSEDHEKVINGVVYDLKKEGFSVSASESTRPFGNGTGFIKAYGKFETGHFSKKFYNLLTIIIRNLL